MPSKESLIQELTRDGYLKTPFIIEAFKEINRADFVPEDVKDEAYLNTALPIGYGQTISQPLVVAFMLELLQPQPGEKILDVGAGSGWKAALLAYCVSQPRTHAGIVSIERIPALKEIAEKNIGKYNFVKKGVVKILLGDGSKGYKKEAPYDKIIAGAAGEEIPQEWKDQLRIGGRIVAPVKNSIVVLEKTAKDKFKTKEYYGFSFVPLIMG